MIELESVPRAILSPSRSRRTPGATARGTTRRSAVFTVGYSGRTVADLIRVLKSNGVRRLIDVRALPLSRRAGFSKTALAAALNAAGIDYVHVREAGNPFRNEADDIATCLRHYRRYLEANPQIVNLVADVAGSRRSALLCVEADPACCHRSVIADCLGSACPAFEVADL